MTRAWPLLLLLAACGATPRPASEPERPEVAACREEARNNTSSRDMWRRQNTSDVNHMDRLRQEMAEAESRAFNDCLRRRGVLRGGGVERVRPTGSAF